MDILTSARLKLPRWKGRISIDSMSPAISLIYYFGEISSRSIGSYWIMDIKFSCWMSHKFKKKSIFSFDLNLYFKIVYYIM